MPGPQPKPNELARKQGNPGRKKLPKLADVIPLNQVDSTPPAHLSVAGQGLWLSLRTSAKWIAESDAALLMMVCEKWDRRAELQAQLAKSDAVLFTDKGYAYANPLVGMLSTIESELAKMLSLLGLSPADRTKLGIAEVKAQSALERLRDKRAQGSS